jgi:hypothetical protein
LTRFGENTNNLEITSIVFTVFIFIATAFAWLISKKSLLSPNSVIVASIALFFVLVTLNAEPLYIKMILQ